MLEQRWALSDGPLDGSNDGKFEGLLLGGSLKSNNGKVLGYQEGIKLVYNDGKVIVTIIEKLMESHLGLLL